jgi:hypothetical protein
MNAHEQWYILLRIATGLREKLGFDSLQKQEIFSSLRRPCRLLDPPNLIFNGHQRLFWEGKQAGL